MLPTLVYLAREKRPQHPHNFKAGAMNALVIRKTTQSTSIYILQYYIVNNSSQFTWASQFAPIFDDLHIHFLFSLFALGMPHS